MHKCEAVFPEECQYLLDEHYMEAADMLAIAVVLCLLLVKDMILICGEMILYILSLDSWLSSSGICRRSFSSLAVRLIHGMCTERLRYALCHPLALPYGIDSHSYVVENPQREYLLVLSCLCLPQQ
ncbi:hypothetical protein K2173_007765 [Erythroxylum novogranatense]|uniref:Uncharacterized protein n=1 Tax=Erythroxylum novogranatense TaxID=1862640 RepID=A0AAV8TCS7_9ROSI|nr:hypothetical protein K2173_007765 [Erythroxylum novogranatense]